MVYYYTCDAIDWNAVLEICSSEEHYSIEIPVSVDTF